MVDKKKRNYINKNKNSKEIKKNDRGSNRGNKLNNTSSIQLQSFENRGGTITDNIYEVCSEFESEKTNIEIEKEANF